MPFTNTQFSKIFKNAAQVTSQVTFPEIQFENTYKYLTSVGKTYGSN